MVEKSLEALLDLRRDEIRQAINEAEAELAALERRESELRGLIRRARLTIGDVEEDSRFKLHEAMERVLRAAGQDGLTARELAAEIKRRGLYTRRDGAPAEANQITARASNYSHQFTRDGSKIRLR